MFELLHNQCFNPRTPVRSTTTKKAQFLRIVTEFQSTYSREEYDVPYLTLQDSTFVFQSTYSREEYDLIFTSREVGTKLFQSTYSREEYDDFHRGEDQEPPAVSIHVLT